MIRPYLIQRAKFKDISIDDVTNIDSILSFDYMGSAEFEFGALFKTLTRIRDRISERMNTYAISHITLNEKEITIFVNTDEVSAIEINTVLNGLGGISKNGYHLKEYSGFNTYISPDEYDIKSQIKHPHNIDLWWDIDNDFIFWKRDDEFELKFMKALKK